MAATLFGDGGEEKPPALGDPSLRFLIASACRFGGPLLRLGLSNVHGISNAAQARQGGPDSSHCPEALSAFLETFYQSSGIAYLYFSYAARVACFAQAISFLSLSSTCRRGRLLHVPIPRMSVCMTIVRRLLLLWMLMLVLVRLRDW